jgi:hypothetical protein
MQLGQAFGQNPLSPVWIRLPALGFGLLSILLMAWVAWRLADGLKHRRAMTFTAASMMALSGFFVYHSQNARPYTMLVCWALLAVSGLLLTQRRPKRGLALMTASLIGGVYTSYWAAPFVVWILGFAWVVRAVPVPWLLGSVGVLALSLTPWLPTFLHQREFTHAAGHYTDGFRNPVQLPEQFWRMLCGFVMKESPWFRVVMLVLALLMGACAWLRQRSNAALSLRSGALPLNLPLWLTLCGSWLLSLLIGHILIDLVGQSHTATIQRYLVLAAPPWLLLISFGLWQTSWLNIPNKQGIPGKGKRWVAPILTGLLLVAMGISAWRVSEGEAFKPEAFKTMAEILQSQGQPEHDLVLIHKSGAPVAGLAYYLEQSKSPLLLQSFNEKLPTGQGSLESVMSWLDDHPEVRRVWWIQTHSSDSVYQAARPVLQTHGLQPVTPLDDQLEGFLWQRFER